jgi:hypothetical protein
LSIFAEELLHGTKIWSRAIVEKMTTPQTPAVREHLRGLGWDIDSSFSTNRGELLPIGSFGTTGFTGTSLWVDPTTNSYVILLTNRVHPRGGNGAIVGLRTRLTTAVASALNLSPSEKEKLRLARITGYNESVMAARRLVARNGDVKAGIDVLEADGFRELQPDAEKPVRVGLVTNQTGVDAQGKRTVDVLAHAPGIQLAAIFSPEHGIAGKLDTTKIGDSRDEATGATVYSVYGDGDAKRLSTTSRTLACRSTHTRARWGISWRLRRSRTSRFMCWTGRIRLAARMCRGRWRMRGTSPLLATGRRRCGMA